MTKNYDLVIVGGGLVGISLLLALRNSGLKIALIEARDQNERVEPELDQRSLVLSLGSKVYYEQLGLWSEISQHVTPINQIKVSEQGVYNKVFLNKKSFGVPALGYVVNIQLLAKAMWDCLGLNKLDNIDILCPYTLKDINQENDYANLVIEPIGNAIEFIEPIELKARIVIAADGGRSYVKQLLNMPSDKHDYNQIALIANVEHQLANENIAYERFSAQGPFAILPRQNQHISGIVWPWPSSKQEYIKNLSDVDLLAELQQLFGYKLGRFKSIGQRQFFPLWRIRSKQLSQQRIILLGNSANNIHPVGGQGFNLGLRDVKYFSKILLDYQESLCLTNWCKDKVSQMFSEYSDLREDDHYNLTNGTHSLLELFASSNAFTKLSRRFGMTVMNHSLVLRTMLANQSMGLTL